MAITVSHVCEIAGCLKKRSTRGLCKSHYNVWYRYGDPLHIPAIAGGRDDTVGAFGLRNRVTGALRIDHETGCWLWQKRLNSDGYGTVQVKKVIYGVHVYVYTTVIGPVPEALQLDHLCNIRNCANPWHLEPVTPDENKRRAGLRRTLCKGGRHPRTPDSQYTKGRNTGRCKFCVREATRKYAAKRSSI